jgi:hypothetical protein
MLGHASIALALVAGLTTGLAAQRPPRLEGTWRAQTPDGPQTVIVRPDSSASFGDETVRWRVLADSIFIALGDEWTGYHFALAGRKLTLSGGDLEEPIVFHRVGPHSPRPDSIPVPAAPPMTRPGAGAAGGP